MSIENNKQINKKVRKCIENLYYLRTIEANHSLKPSEKLSIASPIIKNIQNTLIKIHDFLLYRPLWEELHDRMVYYYEYQNQENLNNKIPLLPFSTDTCYALWRSLTQWKMLCFYSGLIMPD